MTGDITAMSWNVRGEIGISDDRMQRQLRFLDDHTTDIDFFSFQAVNYEKGSTGNREGQLGVFLDYFSAHDYHVVHTGDWARELAESSVQPHANIDAPHNRCNLIASRWPIERRPLTLRNHGDRKPRKLDYYYSHFPDKMLVAETDLSRSDAIAANELELWNVGIINGANWGEEKINMLEIVYARVHLQTANTDIPVLLGGDFNAPQSETADGDIVPHGENAGQYTNHPFYGDPYYLRNPISEMNEFRFDQRWRLAEARIFDSNVGEWYMRDAYWAAEGSRHESSDTDFTHIVHNATPPQKRLDHILVSNQFGVQSCEILNGRGTSVNGLDVSDHAPVVARLLV